MSHQRRHKTSKKSHDDDGYDPGLYPDSSYDQQTHMKPQGSQPYMMASNDFGLNPSNVQQNQVDDSVLFQQQYVLGSDVQWYYTPVQDDYSDVRAEAGSPPRDDEEYEDHQAHYGGQPSGTSLRRAGDFVTDQQQSTSGRLQSSTDSKKARKDKKKKMDKELRKFEEGFKEKKGKKHDHSRHGRGGHASAGAST